MKVADHHSLLKRLKAGNADEQKAAELIERQDRMLSTVFHGLRSALSYKPLHQGLARLEHQLNRFLDYGSSATLMGRLTSENEERMYRDERADRFMP